MNQYRYMLVQKMQEKEIRWKTSFLLLSIYLCLFIFLKGCGNNKSIPDPPEPLPDLPRVSDRLVARIYFDATLSMQGFVVPGSTHYTRICPDLERVIVSGWRDETVSFFRFGERVEPIDRNTYLQVGDESFYQTDIGIKTYIEKIIENEYPLVKPPMEGSNTLEGATEIDVNNMPEEGAEADSTENRLVVIVTDLFQDNGDINRLVPELKEKCIKKGVDVALFGLRSQFDGTVYDIGIGKGSSMRYRSTPGNPETFRPFYLLVLGKHADILHYFDRLKANGFSEAETIIFSQYLVSPLVSFESAAIETTNLNRANYVPEDPRLLQYEIVQNSLPAKISAKGMKYVPLPHAMDFNADTFDPDIIAECKPTPTGNNEISPEAQISLEVIPTISNNENGNELMVDFNLSESLPGSATYLYKVTLRPRIDSYQAPDWCPKWDMGSVPHGARTLNLLNFVNSLSQVTAREHHPQIAKFYFYIGKR